MKPVNWKKPIAALAACCAGAVLLACEPPEPMDPQVEPEQREQSQTGSAQAAATSSKPAAPVAVDYEIIETPALEQSTVIELRFESGLEGPVHVSYRLSDEAALSLDGIQAERTPVDMQAANGYLSGTQRLRLTPHREGRHTLTVLTEIDTENGPLTTSTAIPIEVTGLDTQLQSKQRQPAPQAEVSRDAEGEAIISMPAREE